jgi:hypothetical protein
MTSLIYNQKWNDYVLQCEVDSIIEKICEDSRTQDKGFISDTIGYFKNSIDRFKDWKDNKLMNFVKTTGQKIKNLLKKLRNSRVITGKCSFKLTVIVNMFLNKDEYVRFAASFLETVLMKLARLGIFDIIGSIVPGEEFVSEKIPEAMKTIIESVIEYIENGASEDLFDVWAVAGTLFNSVAIYNKFKKEISSFLSTSAVGSAPCNVDLVNLATMEIA